MISELGLSREEIAKLDPDDPDEMEIASSPSCCFDDADTPREEMRAGFTERERENELASLTAASGKTAVLQRSWRIRGDPNRRKIKS